MFLACFLEFQQLTKVATSVFVTAPWDPGNRLHICEILPGKWRVVESSKRPSHLKYRLLMTAELFTKHHKTAVYITCFILWAKNHQKSGGSKSVEPGGPTCWLHKGCPLLKLKSGFSERTIGSHTPRLWRCIRRFGELHLQISSTGPVEAVQVSCLGPRRLCTVVTSQMNTRITIELIAGSAEPQHLGGLKT